MNINFKGYSNVLCALDVPVNDGKRVSLLTMILNDEDGHKDLSELRKILQMQGFPLGNENEDVLTISYVYDEPNKSENMYFNKKALYWGDELSEIEKKYIPKIMSKEKYKSEERIHMKVYTLIANLTTRLINTQFDNENKEITHVIKNLFENMGAVLKSSENAFKMTNVACLKQFKFQQVAMAFNKGVNKTMEKFFKL